jgi:DNA-binding NtrC family response regulator
VDEANPPTTLATTALRRRVRSAGAIVLRVVQGPNAGESLEVSRSRLTIGRGRGADLLLDDPSVSGLHAEIRLAALPELRDLGSRNGVYVNGRRTFHVVIQPGDSIAIGNCVLEVVALQDVDVDVFEGDRFGELYGRSLVMKELFAELQKLARTSVDVLIHGQTGTGKELVARSIHDHSAVRDKPFVVVDCGCLAPNLAESALFGHAKGAFTGADSDRAGAFEAANRGTIFLDEIGELPLELQIKFLRVLDRREFTRVGETQPRHVWVRVIAATHRNLEELVEVQAFRRDLYFRLARSQVDVPALRERDDDVEFLARTFLAQQRSVERGALDFSPDAMEALRSHRWPGNVRELRNVVERATQLSNGPVIRAADLRLRRHEARATRFEELLRSAEYREVHNEIDRWLLPRIVGECQGNLSHAATKLGISRKGLRERLKRLGLYNAED